MSRKGRLMGAGVLTIVGISTLALSQFPGMGLLNDLKLSNLIALPYVIAAVMLISAIALSLYVSPEEHLWGSDDPACNNDKCRRTRH